MATKITHKQKFTEIISIIENFASDYSTVINGEPLTANDLIEFINGRKEAIEKKATKTTDKTNTEQAEVDSKVLSVMTTANAKVGEIAKAVNSEYEVDYSSSKVTASLRRLVGKGAVVNEVDKKNSYYRLAD